MDRGEILRISQYSARMPENTDQKNSQYGNFLRSNLLQDFLSEFDYKVTN